MVSDSLVTSLRRETRGCDFTREMKESAKIGPDEAEDKRGRAKEGSHIASRVTFVDEENHNLIASLSLSGSTLTKESPSFV